MYEKANIRREHPMLYRALSLLLAFAIILSSVVVGIPRLKAKALSIASDSGTLEFKDANIDYSSKLQQNKDGTYKLTLDFSSNVKQSDQNISNSISGDGYFEAPVTGTYIVQLWGGDGADGYDSTFNSGGSYGKGGYVYSAVQMNKGDIIFYRLGGAGKQTMQSTTGGGVNGNGGGHGDVGNYKVGAGGGYSVAYLYRNDDSTKNAEYFLSIYTDGNGNIKDFNKVTYENDRKDADHYILIAGGGGGGGAADEPGLSGDKSPYTADGGAGGNMSSTKYRVTVGGEQIGIAYAGGNGKSSGLLLDYIGRGGTNVPAKVAGGYNSTDRPNDWNRTVQPTLEGGTGSSGNYFGGGGGAGYCGGSGGAMTSMTKSTNVGGGGGGSSFVTTSIDGVIAIDDDSLGLLDDDIAEIQEAINPRQNLIDGEYLKGGFFKATLINNEELDDGFSWIKENLGFKSEISQYFTIESSTANNVDLSFDTVDSNKFTIDNFDIASGEIATIELTLKPIDGFAGGNDVNLFENEDELSVVSNVTVNNQIPSGKSCDIDLSDETTYVNVPLSGFTMRTSSVNVPTTATSIDVPAINLVDQVNSVRTHGDGFDDFLNITDYKVDGEVVTGHANLTETKFYTMSFDVAPKTAASKAIVGLEVTSTTYFAPAVITQDELVELNGINFSVEKNLTYDANSDTYKFSIKLTTSDNQPLDPVTGVSKLVEEYNPDFDRPDPTRLAATPGSVKVAGNSKTYTVSAMADDVGKGIIDAAYNNKHTSATNDGKTNGTYNTNSYIENTNQTNTSRTFTPTMNGTYLIQVWGARGGDGGDNAAGQGDNVQTVQSAGWGAPGQYVYGVLDLTISDTLSINIGLDGKAGTFGWGSFGSTFNGGGSRQGGAGGTSTSVKFDNTYILIAGGGGGGGGATAGVVLSEREKNGIDCDGGTTGKHDYTASAISKLSASQFATAFNGTEGSKGSSGQTGAGGSSGGYYTASSVATTDAILATYIKSSSILATIKSGTLSMDTANDSTEKTEVVKFTNPGKPEPNNIYGSGFPNTYPETYDETKDYNGDTKTSKTGSGSTATNNLNNDQLAYKEQILNPWLYDEATYRALNVGGGVVITLLEPSEDVREAALEEAKEAAEEAILGRINEISVSYDFQKYFTEVGSGKWAKQPANATTYETDEEHNLVEASYENTYEITFKASDGFLGGYDVPIFTDLELTYGSGESAISKEIPADPKTDYANVKITNPVSVATNSGLTDKTKNVSYGDTVKENDLFTINGTVPTGDNAWKADFVNVGQDKIASLGSVIDPTNGYTATADETFIYKFSVSPLNNAPSLATVGPTTVPNDNEATANVKIADYPVEVNLTHLTSTDAVASVPVGDSVNFKISPESDDYVLPETIIVEVNGVELDVAKYSYDSSTGEITVPADVIDGKVVITAVAENFVPAPYNFHLVYTYLDDGEEVTEQEDFKYMSGTSLSETSIGGTTSVTAAMAAAEAKVTGLAGYDFVWGWNTEDGNPYTKMPSFDYWLFGSLQPWAYKITINYVDSETKEVLATKTEKVWYGLSGTIDVPELPDGYVLDKPEDYASCEYIIDETFAEKNPKNSTRVLIAECSIPAEPSYTVRHVKSDTGAVETEVFELASNPTASPKELTGEYAGYTVSPTSGITAEANGVYTFTYKPVSLEVTLIDITDSEHPYTYPDKITVEKGGVYNDLPTKDGYIGYWYYDEDCTELIPTDPEKMTADDYKNGTVRTDVDTIYVVWHAYPYSVTFDSNGGSGTMADQEFEVGVAEKLNANTYTKKNQVFAGWNTEGDGTGTAYANEEEVVSLTTEKDGVVTLYAQWDDYEIDPSARAEDKNTMTYGSDPITLTAECDKPTTDTTFTYQWYEVVDGSNVPITGATSATYKLPATTPAGNHSYVCEVTATDDSLNCTATEITDPVSITVDKAVITVTPVANQSKDLGTADPTAYRYDFEGNVTGETPVFAGALTRDEGEDIGTYAINQGELVLDETADVNNNYTLEFTPGIFTIKYHETDAVASYGDDPADTGWYNSSTEEAYLVAPNGYLVKIAGSDEDFAASSELLPSTTTDGAKPQYILKKIDNGAITDVKTMTDPYYQDLIKPTGSVTVAPTTWTEIVNAIDFLNLFYKEAIGVTLTTADETGGSGVARKHYIIASEGKTIAQLDAINTWELYPADGTFTIDKPDGNKVVYLRVIDKAGNISYISSAGMVLDTVAPEITAVPSFTAGEWTTASEVTIDVTNILEDTSGIDTVTYSYDGITKDSVTVSSLGEGNSFKIPNKDIPNGIYNIIITATDKAGNVGTSTIQVKRESSDAVVISDPGSKTVTYGDSVAEFVVTAESVSGIESIKWQKSTDNGNTWTDVTTGISAIEKGSKLTVSNPTVVADDGDWYRAIVTTNASKIAGIAYETNVKSPAVLTVLQRELVIAPTNVEYEYGTPESLVTTGLPWDYVSDDKKPINNDDVKIIGKFVREDGVMPDKYTITSGTGDDKIRLDPSVAVNGNYFITINPSAASFEIIEYTPDANATLVGEKPYGWYIKDSDGDGVRITAPENYKISTSNALTDNTWSDYLTVPDGEYNEGYTYYLKYVGEDDDQGNKNGAISVAKKTEAFKQDTVAPTASVSVTAPEKVQTKDGTDYYGGTATVTIANSDDTSGVKTVEYKYSTTPITDPSTITDWTTGTSTTIANGNTGYVYAKVTDNAGLVTYANSNKIVVDTVKPTISIDEDSVKDWINDENFALEVEVSDDYSGVDTVTYKVGDGETKTATVKDGKITIPADELPEGQTSISFTVKDNCGNTETGTVVLKKDTTAPQAKITVDESKLKKLINTLTFGHFFNETVNVTVEEADETSTYKKDLSGIAKVEYYVANDVLTDAQIAAITDWTSVAKVKEKVSVDPDNKYVVYGRITDNAGNVSTVVATYGFITDATVPAITDDAKTTWYTNSSDKVTVTVTDNLAGLDTVKYQVGAGTEKTATISNDKFEIPMSELAEGVNTITIVATDNSTNANGTTEKPYIITVNKDTVAPTATVSVTDPTAPYQTKDDTDYYGDTVTVTIANSDATSGVKTVEYKYSATPITDPSTITDWTTGTSTTIANGNTGYVYAKVTDNAGLVTYAGSNKIAVDTIAPTVEDKDNVSGTFISDPYQDVVIKVADNDGGTGIDTVTYTVNDGTPVTVPVAPDGTITIPANALPNGDYTVSVTATDKCGNETTLDLDISKYTTVGPISGTVTDDNDEPVPEATVELLDKNGNPVLDPEGNPITATTDSDGKYILEDVPDGDYKIKVTPKDPEQLKDKTIEVTKKNGDAIPTADVKLDGYDVYEQAEKDVNTDVEIRIEVKVDGLIDFDNVNATSKTDISKVLLESIDKDDLDVILDGGRIEVVMTVKEIPQNIPNEKRIAADNLLLAKHVEITIVKSWYDMYDILIKSKNITRTAEPISFVVPIGEFEKEGRQFYVYGEHGDRAPATKTPDGDGIYITPTVEFATQDFSIFSIAYAPEEEKVAKTLDDSPIVATAMMMALSAAGLIVVAKKKREDEE
mgnify:CR=1 FL=1